MPRHVSGLLAEIRERGRTLLPSQPAASVTGERTGLGFIAEAPRAAAAAIIAVLGFGALVGSLAGGAGASDPGVVVAMVAHPPAQSTASTPASPSPEPATRTITEEAPAPSTSASPPPAPAPAQTAPGNDAPAAPRLPPIKHVFLIMLSNQGYSQTFGQSTSDPYLAKTLAAKGELITNYYSVAAGSLANEIALISGQGPTQQTQANCPQYQPIQPATIDDSGQVIGDGCGYPAGVITIGDQLRDAHLKFKVYLGTQNATDDPKLERCHPQPGSAPGDPAQPYAAWRNPFLYFAGTNSATCPEEHVPLAQLDKDLKSSAATPALSYIVPDLCDSGAGTPCAPSTPSGMQAADAFLQSVVPKIQKSQAYKSGGMIAITFDQAPQTGPAADPSSCCGQPTYPNLASSGSPTGTTTPPDCATPDGSSPSGNQGTQTTPPSGNQGSQTTPPTPSGSGTTGDQTPSGSGTTGTTGPTGCAPTGQARGGGVVGLLLLTKYVKPGSINGLDLYNHFSLLASIEDLFGLDRLGYAAAPGLPVFGTSVYTAYSG